MSGFTTNMGVDFSESSTEQKIGIEKKYQHPRKDAGAKGVRLVKEADFGAEKK